MMGFIQQNNITLKPMENNRNIIETYNQLTHKQKMKYKTYCENKYGASFIESEFGEPLFFSKDGEIINTKIIIDLLFNINKN